MEGLLFDGWRSPASASSLNQPKVKVDKECIMQQKDPPKKAVALVAVHHLHCNGPRGANRNQILARPFHFQA